MNQETISRAIIADEWMMKVLRAAEGLDLPDWWIGAGFLRNKVWDILEGNESKPTRDVDLVYFDATKHHKKDDLAFDEKMNSNYPLAEWEIRNQARMHYINNFDPFTSTKDGISHWVETATCVAVKLNNGNLDYLFCHGTEDLYGLIARPTPSFQSTELIGRFYERVETKQWKKRWPSLKVVEN